MKNTKIKTIFVLSVTGLLTLSCGNGASSSVSTASSSASSASGTSIASSASSSSTPRALDLESCFENTANYALLPSGNKRFTIEYISNQIYYNYFAGGGLIVLNEDPNNAHEFTVDFVDLQDDYTHFKMNVHGIIGKAADIATYNLTHGFKYTLSSYLDDFVATSDPYTFSCTVSALATTCKNYFQALSLAYCNYFEIHTTVDGKLDSFTCYEKDTGGTPAAVMSVSFVNETLLDFEAYKLWNDDGRKINMRIMDWKNGAYTQTGPVFYYEDTAATLNGTITTIDANGYYYLAATDNQNGPVGIRCLKSKNEQGTLEIGDQVSLSGTIRSFGTEVYLDSFTIASKSETKASYLPAYDEEPAASANGDGVYAAMLFSQAPNYSGSLYDFECYVKDVVTTGTAYGSATLVFPKYKSGTEMLMIQLRIDKSLASYDTLMAFLGSCTSYGEENPTKIAIDKGLVQFAVENASFSYLAIAVTPTTTVSKALSSLEKARAILQDDTFVLPTLEADTTTTCYHIGPGVGESIEALYGISEVTTKALKFMGSVADLAAVNSYITTLEGLGFALAEEIRDTGGSLHYILVKGSSIVDMAANSSYSGYTIVLFLYHATSYLHGTTLNEKIATAFPSEFPASDYVKISGSYEADYSFFALTSYAGNTYSGDKFKVSCISLHGDYAASIASYNDLVAAYQAKGYSYYTDSAGKVVTYRTRGVTHRLLAKNGVIIDLSIYPSSDYTFTGSDEFTYRIEVAIYKESDYKGVHYESDTSRINAALSKEYGADYTINFTLSDCSYEFYEGNSDANAIDYGYGYESDVFFYPGGSSTPGKLLSALQASLVASGYVLSSTSSKGNMFYLKTTSTGSAAVLLMPNRDKGYIRLLLAAGGTRF